MKNMYFVAGLLLMIVQSSWQSALQDREEKSSNGLARRHAEYERHADGTFTSDISSYLESQAAKEFIAWLANGGGRRDFSEGAGVAENVGRRHADGTFTSDYHKFLDEEAGKEFLKWLMSNKPTQR
uniref:Glucagon n=1 Tax=Podarcis muralis TaxID=64176 RepID=A0A670IWE2_PODMU